MLGRSASRTFAVSIILLLTTASVAVWPFAASADDAGAGCGVESAPCHVAPGDHSGSLQPFVNEQDYYAFTVAEGPFIVRLSGSAGVELEFSLIDPEGNLRSTGRTLFEPSVAISAMGIPEGTWRLVVGYTPFASPALLGDTYEFTLGLEQVDHVAHLTLPGGDARSVAAWFNEGSDAYLEAAFPGNVGFGVPSYVTTYMIAVQTAEGSGLGMGATTFCCAMGEPEVRTWGSLSDVPRLEVPRPDGGEGRLATAHFENDGEAMNVSIGIGSSSGLGTGHAWLAWNGPDRPRVEVGTEDTAFFHRLTSFEGDSDGLYAAGYAHADDLHRSDEIPSHETHLSMLGYNGRSAAAALRPTQMTLTGPDGETSSISGQWGTLFAGDAKPGTWRVDVAHVDGLENDRIAFWGVAFEDRLGMRALF